MLLLSVVAVITCLQSVICRPRDSWGNIAKALRAFVRDVLLCSVSEVSEMSEGNVYGPDNIECMCIPRLLV